MTARPPAPRPIPVPSPEAAGRVIAIPAAGPPGAPGQPGPPGPQGPTGDAATGPVFWSGQGAPPDVIPGAKPGDRYLDELTGTIYQLA